MDDYDDGSIRMTGGGVQLLPRPVARRQPAAVYYPSLRVLEIEEDEKELQYASAPVQMGIFVAFLLAIDLSLVYVIYTYDAKRETVVAFYLCCVLTSMASVCLARENGWTPRRLLRCREIYYPLQFFLFFKAYDLYLQTFSPSLAMDRMFDNISAMLILSTFMCLVHAATYVDKESFTEALAV